MKECRQARKNMAAFQSGELEGREREQVIRHIEQCAACRAELELFQRTLQSADALKPEFDKVMASIDWDEMSEKIVASAWDKRKRPRTLPEREKFWLFSPKLKPVVAGLLLGILVGAVAAWFVFRGRTSENGGVASLFASKEFLDRVDLEIARRETLDYLEKSQAVLLEFAQSSAADGKFRLNEAVAAKARELLSKKKFLNLQLEKAQMAKAKDICDQIELLFYELAAVSEGLTEAERQEIQNLIEDRSLLLKIRLLKKELQKSEV
ncbi:MAG: zf-HC2 domain-containing protein [Clostridiales bacterium]|nr:zf-HC2 domain-containing protein [Clostridiales bacterium]